MADQSYWVAKAAFIEGRMENVLERKKQLYTLQEMLVKELPHIKIGLHEGMYQFCRTASQTKLQTLLLNIITSDGIYHRSTKGLIRCSC